MKGEQQGSYRKLYIVLDTAAFLAKYPLQQYSTYELLTTPHVLSEVRDRESREALEMALSIGRVRVVEPSKEYMDKAMGIARSIGEHSSLSTADLSVLALALQYLVHGSVVVITDDYALQNTLLYTGIPFKPLRTTGIHGFRRYIVLCPVCGYVSSVIGEKNCPLCGSRLVKRKLS